MAEIFADPSDGVIATSAASWAGARDATSGTVSSLTVSNTNPTVGSSRNAPKGGGYNYTVRRMFMWFDTSGISGNVSAAAVHIHGAGATTGASVRAVKSTAFGGDGGTALAAGDFDAMVGWSAGSGATGNVTQYADAVSGTFALGGYNILAGTSDLMTDMQNDSVVILCFLEYGYDWRNMTWTSNGSVQIGNYFADNTGTSKDPKIVYTEDASGYTHDVMGVAAASVGEVIGVATANIGKVIGV